MRGTSLTSLSFIVLVAAIAAWVGVWFLYADVSARLNDRAQSISSAAVQNVQEASVAEVSALASNTASQRAELDQQVGTDIVGIANEIQDAGKTAGTDTIIGSATPTGDPNSAAGTTELLFTAQSTGTFAQVWRAAQLFQTLPIPSQVQELDFEEIPSSSGGATWQLTAQIEVLTSTQLTS